MNNEPNSAEKNTPLLVVNGVVIDDGKIVSAPKGYGTWHRSLFNWLVQPPKLQYTLGDAIGIAQDGLMGPNAIQTSGMLNRFGRGVERLITIPTLVAAATLLVTGGTPVLPLLFGVVALKTAAVAAGAGVDNVAGRLYDKIYNGPKI